MAAAVLPFLAVHLTYLLAAGYGQVDWCLPYVDSCTSISATGRQPPASYLFRATMLPAAVVLMAYWWLNHGWLGTLCSQAGMDGNIRLRWMLVLGLIAGLGLILYVTVLGEAGDWWARQRRAGVVLFFGFSYLAQLLFAAQLRALAPLLPNVQRLALSMYGLCWLLLALGLLSVVLAAQDKSAYEQIEDAFEWCLALLLQLNFLLGYLVWQRAGFELQPRSR